MGFRYAHTIAMTYDDVISYYGTEQAAADALGIKQPSVHAWKDAGISMPRQSHIQISTRGRLRANPKHAKKLERAEA